MQLPVFSLGDDVYTWQDVLAHARATGEWASLEQAALEGVACESLADSGEVEEPDDDIEHAADEFRYERDLVTAAEMEAWLEEQGLSVADWMGCMRRAVLRAHWQEDLPRIIEEQAPDAGAVEEALRVDLRCTGMDLVLAQRLAADVAAWAARREASGTQGEPSRPDLTRLVQEAAEFRQGIARDEAIQREISAAHLDWIRVECRVVAFEDEAEAREGVLCIRDDGMELDELAADAHVEPRDVQFYVDDLPADQRAPFLSAQVGEAVGPIRQDGVHAIYQVRAKVLPGVGDEALLERARSAIVDRALTTEVNNRIRWHAQRPAT